MKKMNDIPKTVVKKVSGNFYVNRQQIRKQMKFRIFCLRNTIKLEWYRLIHLYCNTAYLCTNCIVPFMHLCWNNRRMLIYCEVYLFFKCSVKMNSLIKDPNNYLNILILYITTVLKWKGSFFEKHTICFYITLYFQILIELI